MGSLNILNVGSGDISLQFNNDDEAETQRAKKMITEMLERGYAVLVDVDGELRPVRRFDPEHGLYIIQDAPKRKGKTRSVPMTETKATAIGRSAGG